MAAQSYSFIDVNASITGPGGTFALGSGAAEEGITIDQADDKTSLIMGADGSGMHSLHAAANGIVTVTLLKTSPVNQLLMAMYNLQSAPAALTGQAPAARLCEGRQHPALGVQLRADQLRARLRRTFSDLRLTPYE